MTTDDSALHLHDILSETGCSKHEDKGSWLYVSPRGGTSPSDLTGMCASFGSFWHEHSGNGMYFSKRNSEVGV